MPLECPEPETLEILESQAERLENRRTDLQIVAVYTAAVYIAAVVAVGQKKPGLCTKKRRQIVVVVGHVEGVDGGYFAGSTLHLQLQHMDYTFLIGN